MHRLHCTRLSIAQATLAIALLSMAGCQTLTSLGLPVSSTYELTDTASRISQSHTLPAAIPRELSEDVLASYIVEPGDVLFLEPADFDSPIRLPGDQPVQPDGTIELGRYGRIRVAGQTLDQIRTHVQAVVSAREVARAASAQGQDQSVDGDMNEIIVRLVDWKSKVFYVVGEVNSPGAYPYAGNETVLDALLAAGDITRRANRHQIILSRATAPCDQRVVLPICYDHIVQIGDASSNYQIMPGDRIFVPGISLLDDVMQSLGSCLPGHEQCPRCGPRQVAQPISKIQCVSPCTDHLPAKQLSARTPSRGHFRR